ncbi:MAG: hypothetical protein WD601_07355 [Pseudohongiellaceae bacterium]
MNKFAYSALVAFVSSLLTLITLVWVAPSVAETDGALREIGLD